LTTEKAARQELWRRGIIAGWYLRDDQLPVYHFLHAHRFPVFEGSRRYGKTTCDLTFVLEKLIQNEGWIWRWCEPWKYQAREIVIPELDKIQEQAPSHLRFKHYKTDSFYAHPMTESKLYLRGVNEDRGESSRGSFANGITADEFGSWKDPDYIVNEVLLAQLLTTGGPLHCLSTPPRNIGHRWYSLKDEAMKENRFFQRLVSDNASLTPEDIELMCAAVGGVKSSAWLREFLCQKVADAKTLVIPEFTESETISVVDDDYPRPPFFDAYVAGDSGADDNTAQLFGYYDFLKDEIVIEHEYVASGKTSAEDIAEAKKREAFLWGTDCICSDKPCFEHAKRPYRRVYDSDKKGLIDIIVTHAYPAYAPEKTDKLAAIRAFRVRVKQGKFKVKKRCKILIHQLKVGQWANEKHLDFERSDDDELKHLDAIAAAVYFNRSIVKDRNPYPQNAGISVYTHHIPKELSSQGHQRDEEAIASLFRPLG
jgi:hypothetical protein